MQLKQLFPGVYRANGLLATRNLVKGFKAHGEQLLLERGAEYRVWEPRQSKLAAAIARGLKTLPIREGSKILYLGAAQGVTASFVSDIVGARGIVYCIEFAPRAMRDLLRVCEARGNMLPILADARKPQDYAGDVKEVDVVYEDVADPQQAQIMKENARAFLKKGGFGLLAVKARCVSSIVEPKKVYAQAIRELESDFEVVEKIDLAPFEEDHLFLVLKKKA